MPREADDLLRSHSIDCVTRNKANAFVCPCQLPVIDN